MPRPVNEIEGDKNIFMRINRVKIQYNEEVRETVGEIMIMNRFYRVIYHKI